MINNKEDTVKRICHKRLFGHSSITIKNIPIKPYITILAKDFSFKYIKIQDILFKNEEINDSMCDTS